MADNTQGFITEEAQRLRNLADESMWEDPDRPDVEFLFSYDDPDRWEKLKLNVNEDELKIKLN